MGRSALRLLLQRKVCGMASSIPAVRMCARKAVAAPAIRTVNANRTMVLRRVSSIPHAPGNGVGVRELYGYDVVKGSSLNASVFCVWFESSPSPPY
jgi:hypothetical protein